MATTTTTMITTEEENTPKKDNPTDDDDDDDNDVELGGGTNNNNDKAELVHHHCCRDTANNSLFTEVHDALHGAFLMFCLPDLKALATEGGKLQGPPDMIARIVTPPVTLLDVVTIYNQNKDLLTQERLGDAERADMYHAALNLHTAADIVLEEQREAVMKQVTLHVLDDVNEETECVWALGCNTFTQRITIAFRGSVTNKDFQQDAKALLSYVVNPVKGNYNTTTTEEEELPDSVGLHLGFKEYLYGTATERKREPHKTPKYKIILDKAVELLQANPGFELRIVGHSLGGALTTVLALEAAGDDRIPGSILAITSGAPKVGNLDFQTSFTAMERVGRIRCLQVANDQDPVTKSPPVGNFDPCGPLLCRQRIFRHVGLRLLLVPKGYLIWYPMKAKSYPGILYYDLVYVFTNCCLFFMGCLVVTFCCNIFTILALPLCCCCTYKTLKTSRKHHTQLKYIRRLEFCQDALEQLKLDQLNEERFGRSVYAYSRVLAKHKTSSRFTNSMFDSFHKSVGALSNNNSATAATKKVQGNNNNNNKDGTTMTDKPMMMITNNDDGIDTNDATQEQQR